MKRIPINIFSKEIFLTVAVKGCLIIAILLMVFIMLTGLFSSSEATSTPSNSDFVMIGWSDLKDAKIGVKSGFEGAAHP